MPKNVYQIFGHRSCEDNAPTIRGRCFRLESQVELGGHLSVVKLSGDGDSEVIKIKNDIYDETRIAKMNLIKQKFTYPEGKEPKNVGELVQYFRSRDDIEEKVVGGNIHSFNFARSVFAKGNWNEINVKARGLFIKVKDDSFGFEPYIVARGYDKFFNYEENSHTTSKSLEKTLQFPVTAYGKENGHLALLGYDEEKDELVYTSKSQLDSDHAIWFKNLFISKYANEDGIKKIKNLLKTKNVCMVFECVDTKNDPHVIEYPESTIVLLDVFHRTMEENRFSYETIKALGEELGIPVKKKIGDFNSMKEIDDFISSSSYMKGEIEGVVFEDSNNFKFKAKTSYYKLWKKLRTIPMRIFKGKKVNMGQLYTPLENHFYSWLKNSVIGKSEDEREKFLTSSIIELRREFLKTQK